MAAVKIAMEVFPPLTTQCANNLQRLTSTRNCYTGSENELLSLVLDVCKTPYTLHPIDPAEMGKLDNGMFTKTLALVQNGSIDMFNTQWVVSESRINAFNFGLVAYQLQMSLIVPKPEIGQVQMAWRFFAAFQPRVYAVSFLLALLLVLVLHFIDTTVYRGKAWGNFLGGSRWKMLAPYYGIGDRASRRLILVIMGLFSVVSLELFQVLLLTQLSQPTRPYRFTFDTLIRRLESGELRLIASNDYFYFNENIQTSNETNYRRLRAALKNNPLVFESDRERAMKMVEEGGYAMRSEVDWATYETRNRCHLEVVPLDGFASVWTAYMVSKRSKMNLNKFRKCHLDLTGYREEKESVYWRRLRRETDAYCGTTKVPLFEAKPLQLSSLRGVIALFLGGLLLGVVGFCVEICKFNQQKEIRYRREAELLAEVQGVVERAKLAWNCYLARRGTACRECSSVVIIAFNERNLSNKSPIQQRSLSVVSAAPIQADVGHSRNRYSCKW